ncbi:hypothetical protein A8M77_03475 [Variovorax sp. JS1663]|nr:hypothetical protein A8M77_03475 [Variovorax sp. JS1663]
MLAHFDPDALQPAGDDASQSDFSALLEDCTVLQDDAGQPVWSLKLDVRQRVLHHMASSEAMVAALAANPQRTRSPLQALLEQALRGEAVDPTVQDAQGMKALARVSEWLSGLLPNVPDTATLAAHYERHQLLAPLRALADRHFAGRSNEVDQLSDFVGVLPPDSLGTRLRRAIRSVQGWGSKVLMLHGLGGVGKSAVIARFLLDHIDAEGADPLSWIYLDLDRAELDPLEPATLLAEAARQLGVQHSWLRDETSALRRSLLAELHTVRRRRGDLKSQTTQPSVDLALVSEGIYRVLAQVAQAGPIVVVLDTFELVQHHGPNAVQTLWAFLSRLRQREPALRLVLSGRAVLIDPDVHPVPLAPLEEASALANLASLGIGDPAMAKVVFEKVGGHPLCLRLAARLVLGHDEQGKPDAGKLEGLKTRSALGPLQLMRLDAQVIQGLLYERLLGPLALKDPQLRKLAHPGLVLRRVTPDVILRVLSEPCGLQLQTLEQAQEIFDKLAQQVWIVDRMPDGALRHRGDLRGTMLPLLQADKRRCALAIHMAAVAYYADEQRSSVAERAEEIYHRLMLGQTMEEVEPRWIDGVQTELWPSYEDFTLHARTVLSLLTGESVDSAIADAADQASWERFAWVEALQARTLGARDQALGRLTERAERLPGSRLYGLQAQLLSELGRHREALAVLDAGIASAAAAGLQAQADMLDLMLQRARVEAVAGDPSVTVDELAQLEGFMALSSRYHDDPRLLELGALMLARMRPSAAERDLEGHLMALWQAQPSAIPAGEQLALAFQLVGALYERRPMSVRERLANANLGSELAASAAAEQGSSDRSCRDLLTRLARAVDVALPQRSVQEQAHGWLDSTMSGQRYSALAYTYGRLIDELLVNLDRLLAPQRRGFLQLLRESLPGLASGDAAAATSSPSAEWTDGLLAADNAYSSLVLDDGQPFLGRHMLRHFLQQVGTQNSVKLLLVDGPPGSGKSYSARLVDAVARRTGAFDACVLSMSRTGVGIDELMRTLVIRLGLEPATMPSSALLFLRRTGIYAQWLTAQLVKRTRPVVLVVDDLDRPDLAPDVGELLVMLARTAQSSQPPGLKLHMVLLGAPPRYQDLRGQPGVWTEALQPLSEAEVADFLKRFERTGRISVAQSRDVMSNLAPRLGVTVQGGANAHIHGALNTLVRVQLPAKDDAEG